MREPTPTSDRMHAMCAEKHSDVRIIYVITGIDCISFIQMLFRHRASYANAKCLTFVTKVNSNIHNNDRDFQFRYQPTRSIYSLCALLWSHLSFQRSHLFFFSLSFFFLNRWMKWFLIMTFKVRTAQHHQETWNIRIIFK